MTGALPTAGPWVSDEVWASLDPRAGQPSRRTIRALLLLAIGLAAVVVAGSTLWQRALRSPEIDVADGSGISSQIGSQQLVASFDLGNHSGRSARIAGLASSGDLRIVSVRGLPERLAAHASAAVTVRVQITDCGATRRNAGSLYVRVARPLGHSSERLDLPFSALAHTACKGH